MHILEVLLRIGLALVIGTVIGIERERKNRPAGMRTHVLVCLGSCLIALIESDTMASLAQSSQELHNVSFTLGRMSAQVISGIGFLGAGTIFMAHKKIAGLTTAASLWNVACLGLAVGMGRYAIAIIGCVLVIIVLMALQKIVHVNSVKAVEVRFIHRKETMDYLNAYLNRMGVKVLDVDFRVDSRDTGNIYTNRYVLHLPKNVSYTDIVLELSEHVNIQSIRTTNT